MLLKGQLIHIKEGISRRFRHKITLGQEKKPWHTKVVMSSMHPNHLPHIAKHEGVRQVCTVETVLDLCDMEYKNDKWYHRRKTYRLAEFDVKLRVGAGLHFEIWGHRGCKSKAHDEIDVQWEVPGDSDQNQLARGLVKKAVR